MKQNNDKKKRWTFDVCLPCILWVVGLCFWNLTWSILLTNSSAIQSLSILSFYLYSHSVLTKYCGFTRLILQLYSLLLCTRGFGPLWFLQTGAVKDRERGRGERERHNPAQRKRGERERERTHTHTLLNTWHSSLRVKEQVHEIFSSTLSHLF